MTKGVFPISTGILILFATLGMDGAIQGQSPDAKQEIMKLQKRLAEQEKLLGQQNETLALQEKLIAQQEKLVAKLQSGLQEALSALKESVERNRKLLDRVIELEKEKFGDRVDPRVNPPAKAVRGKVTAVDGASGTVTISLGSADGLAKSNTLEVFRITPKALYIGLLKIDEVGTKESTGKLLRPDRGRVEVGDQVIDQLK